MNLRNKKPLEDKRIGIFGKGVSGKSTVAVLFVQALQIEGYSIILLDADSTNTGMAQVLGFDRSPTPLLDYFGGMVFRGGKVTCPVDDPTFLEGSDLAIKRLPQKYYVQSKGTTLLVAGKLGDKGPGAGCDGPIAKIARDLHLRLAGESPVTVIDFKAGFEDSARGVLTSLDQVIVVVDPTIAAIEMAANMENMVERIKAGELPATQHLESLDLVSIANRLYQQARVKGVLAVMNKIENSEMENYMRIELINRGVKPFCTIHVDHDISESWLRGFPLKSWANKLEAHKIVGELEAIQEVQEINLAAA